MSAATKRKHVAKEIVSEYPPLPDPPELFVARILASRGNNLHLVEAVVDDAHQENCVESSADSLHQFLVSMPAKFRKNFWIKRGDFILCTPIDEGDKVKAEIVRVLYKEDIRYIREQKKWPREFESGEGEGNDHSDDGMFPSSEEDSEECEYEDGHDCPVRTGS